MLEMLLTFGLKPHDGKLGLALARHVGAHIEQTLQSLHVVDDVLAREVRRKEAQAEVP